MGKRWILIACGVAVASLMFWSNVHAGLLSPNDEEQFERMDQPWNIGFSFAVFGESIPINALGVWEDSDGLDNDIEVGIWFEFEDAPIATVIVPAGDRGILYDGFRYATIDPIELEPGEEYVLGALTSFDGDAFNDPYNVANDLTASGFDIDPRIEWLQNRYENGPNEFGELALQKPVRDGTGGVGRWAGANATFLGVDKSLQAGDADQDLDFDQLDLVAVQIAAKYLTGAPATWGEGDWDGAPGGSQGNPPEGDGSFDQADIIAALTAGTYLTGPYAALLHSGMANDDQTSVIYNPSTGEIGVDASAGIELTSINIDSAVGIFTGDAAANLGGSFDNDTDDNIFKATFGSSFGSLSFANVAQAGLSQDVVLNDLTVVGSLAGGGNLGAVDLIYVPEPSSLALVLLATASVLATRRRR